VAKKQTGAQQPGLTRGKAVLIGVLSIVLLVVLYVQYGKYIGDSGNVDAQAAASRAPARKLTRTETTSPAELSAEPEGDAQAALLEFDQSKWKPPEVSKVIAYDPFALPAGFPRPSATGALNLAEGVTTVTAEEKSRQLADALAELRMQLDELKQRGVHVIVGQKNEYVAMIGDRQIRVGDEINGFTVTKIDLKEGVIVERRSLE
jgi:hypothetical protein